MAFKNIRIEDDNDILNKRNSRELLYHGNPNIIKPTKELENKKRVRPLAAAILGLDNTSIPLPNNHDTIDYWTDHDALESYLKTKPTCYLIMGQHGGGSFSLGEAFAKKKNVIHLCPKNILLDEMEHKSITGKCIDFNLRHNKICKFDTIFAMLQQKLQSPAIKHRGFVISGLPLIDNGLDMKHIIDKLFSEEAYSIAESIIQDLLCLKKSNKLKSVSSNSPASTDIELSEEEFEEEDEIDKEDNREIESLDLSKFLLNSCNNILSLSGKIYEAKKSVLLRQVKDLFGFSPDVIINISYPFNDLVRRRIRRYYNYATDSRENDHIPTFGKDSEVRWPASCTLYENNKQIIDSRIFNPKYNCRHPIHFEEKTYKQICNYKQHVNEYVEMKFKEFHPVKIINLDGRISLHEKLRNIQERMSLLPANPVLIPEPLYLDDPPEDYDDFWKTVQDLNVIRNGSVTFNRFDSPWYNRCPVELQQRRSVQGKTKYSVTFYKYVFILSSLNAMSLFCKNPRPYLKLNYLEPTCRTIIIGTKSSGKSMIAKCLSWIFDAPIICYTQFLKEKEQEKYKKISENILSEIIATIEDKRLSEWERLELERKSNLNTWFNKMSNALHTYVSIIKNTADNIQENELNKTVSDKHSNIINELSFLPMLNDLESCEIVLQNHNLLKYAPNHLTTEISKPSTPALDDEDVSQEICEYIAANNLQNDLVPTTEEVMSEIIDIIKSFDLKAHDNNHNIYGKFIIDGFPPNPDLWEHLIKSDLLPDYTISIFENREIDSELIGRYVAIERSVKSYFERIILSNDVLLKTKLLHETPIDTITSYIQLLIDGALHIALSTIFEENDNEKNDTDKILSFTEEVDSFRENWELLKLKLDENNKLFVEIEIGDHSDIEILDEVLLKLRKCYCRPCFKYEGEIFDSDEDGGLKDILFDNESRYLGETKIYCPICFYDHGILWSGREEISLKFDNRLYYFNSDECSDLFQNDVTKYQKYNSPFKKIPSIRICIVGCIGSGKSEISKKIAKELGLLYVDFDHFLNTFLLPRHFRKVGWKYENSFIDTIFDDDRDIEFQVDEENINIDYEFFSNEQDFRRILHNYFERGGPLPTTWIRKLLRKLWNEPPFANTGVVIDGFPKSVNDVENMSACFCIPDLVIELEGSYDATQQRLSSYFTQIWKNQMHEAKFKAEMKLKKEKQEWMQFITTKVIVKLIIDNILDNFLIDVEPQLTQSTESLIIDAHPSGSINVDPNLFTTYNELIQEYPEPVDQNEWEKIDDALEKMNSRWEQIFEVNEENIRAMKDYLLEQNINSLSVNANKSHENVFRNILMKLTFIRNRYYDSFFEQTFVVSCDIAEMLLLEGFFLLSRFYRMCPVHIYENPSTILHTFNLSKNRGRLFPVIHRTYIYFISSKENTIKFRKNPLKYLDTNILKTYQHYPIRMAVVGPPKSGKSKLTSKLAKRYGLLCISKGMAIRYILQEMRWIDLGLDFVKALRTGKCIDSELIIKAILTLLMDSRATINGFVLDGFPETPFEASELLKYGIYPFIIYYLNSSEQSIKGNSQREVYYDIIKEKPPYSMSFITCRYTNWLSRFNLMRDWIEKDTQNIHLIDGNSSQWQCHSDAVNIVESIIPRIHYYLNYVDNKVVSVGMLGISNECFEKKMSCFKNLCPLCLHKNILRHNGYPPNKSGLVQFKDKYYWVCHDHLKLVLHDSKRLTDLKDIKIPEIPIVIQNINMTLIYEGGICLVTYAENLPSQKIVNGKMEYAATYSGRVYLFCTSECLDKFLATPHMYYDITVFKEFQTLPKLSLKSLPNLGYLEQTIGNIITDACCAVNVIRPKYPGLNISLSGLLYVALYLKTFNSLEDKNMVQIYKKKLRSFESRSKLITTIGSRLRSMRNPFTIYPQCCYRHDEKERNIASSSSSSFTSSSLASRVPVPDERFDYLCQYHKPASKVPAFLNVVDIAGLVRGAAEGQGLGNAFLSHIKACDAIFNLCRAFDDEDVIHVDGEVNPVRDLETIGEELRLKDEEQLLQNIDKLDRVVNRGNDKKLKPEYDALMKIKSILVDEKKHIRFGDWSAAEIEVLNKYLFLTSKPALYLVNLSEKDYIRKKNKWLPKLKEWIDKNDPGAPLVPFSGVLESKLLDMDPEEKKAFLKEHNITSALDKIIVQGYKALQLEYFFTAGPDEVKAWTIQKGTKAPQAAGKIHTDFEKGFIMAEVMHFKDFKEEGTEAACKAAGKYRQQGRNYVVEDGDIIFFKFNAGAGLKDAKKK